MHQSHSVSINPKILNILAKQQNDLATKTPDGVIFYMNPDGDVLDIQADIIGPGNYLYYLMMFCEVETPFEGGVFKMKIVIDSEFPNKPPKGYFLTKIFHPNVAQPSGEICVNTLKKDWNPSKWSLSHIFEVVKCLLIVPFPESSLNEEAGRQFMENYSEFFMHAKLYTQVHAKPTPVQLKMIETHYREHYKEVKKQEEHKQEEDHQMTDVNGMQPGQQMFGKESSVLSQVTNSFVPTAHIEGKGSEMFMGGLGMGMSPGVSPNPQKLAQPKKTTAAADNKKKWMRRI